MSLINYIASGGIGNRVAAISAYVYDKLYIHSDVSLVWNKNGMENALPEQIWDNWNLSYITKPNGEINTTIWYIPSNASKSNVVKNWWDSLIPNKEIQNGLLTLKNKYDCGIVIRDLHWMKTNINIGLLNNLINLHKNKTALIVGDSDVSIDKFIKTLTINVDKYKNAIHFINDFDERSYNHTISSLIEWYAIQRCSIIYKNTPASTFTDFSEYIKNIPINII